MAMAKSPEMFKQMATDVLELCSKYNQLPNDGKSPFKVVVVISALSRHYNIIPDDWLFAELHAVFNPGRKALEGCEQSAINRNIYVSKYYEPPERIESSARFDPDVNLICIDTFSTPNLAWALIQKHRLIEYAARGTMVRVYERGGNCSHTWRQPDERV
jgi:hypothetical protein